MNPLYEAAREAVDFMTARDWRFCVIGGLAVIRWGEQRQTQDVDITLLVEFGDEERIAREMLTQFAPRIPDPLDFALRHRVLLVKAANGIPLDLSLGGVPFEKRVVHRASVFEFAPGCALPTCSAEDLIVLKAFAGRPRDWLDIEMIAARQKSIDWKLTLREIEPLARLKETPEIADRLRQLSRS
jgi:hypothetical protein